MRATTSAAAARALARRLLMTSGMSQTRGRESFSVRFWGVRGSLACAGPDIAQVGGNTSCVEARRGDTRIIFDAGTGMRALGASLLRTTPSEAPLHLHLFLSHYHWDHIQGLPFFLPAYRPGTRIDVYGPRPSGPGAANLGEVLARQMQRPFFPVGPEAFRAELRFFELEPDDRCELAGVTVKVASTNHPGGGLAYRLDDGQRAVVYATDTEHGPAPASPDPALLDLAHGADLVVYDAQYTSAEYTSKVGWGHSTAAEGVRLARAAGVPRLALFHHDPGHDDWAIAAIESDARASFPGAFAAREGMEVALDAHDAAG